MLNPFLFHAEVFPSFPPSSRLPCRVNHHVSNGALLWAHQKSVSQGGRGRGGGGHIIGALDISGAIQQ